MMNPATHNHTQSGRGHNYCTLTQNSQVFKAFWNANQSKNNYKPFFNIYWETQ